MPRPAQRLGAYAVCRRTDGALLLAGPPDALVLPGGAVAHGEHPRASVARALREQAGLLVSVGEPLFAHGWLDDEDVHQVAVTFEAHPLDEHVRPGAGALWREQGEPGDLVVPPLPALAERPDGDGPVVRQRVAAYAVVLDGAGSILLTQLSERTPAPGRWTLPGGGLDHGEDPAAAVVREVHEETGHEIVVDQLVSVDSTHFTGTAPSGVEEDFHGVRLVYAVHPVVAADPVVHDAGGTTAAARWVRVSEADQLDLVPLARLGLSVARRTV